MNKVKAAKSKRGLFSIRHERYPGNHPEECREITESALKEWRDKSAKILKDANLPYSFSGSHFGRYHERIAEGKLDALTLAYPILTFSCRALSAFEGASKAESAGEAAEYAYRAGYNVWQASRAVADYYLLDLEHPIMHGQKNINNLKEIRETSNDKRSVEAEQMHKKWQKVADDIWSEHPDYSASRVAGILKRRLNPQREGKDRTGEIILTEYSEDYIRKKIKKVGHAR